jgi:hypothetical protein
MSKLFLTLSVLSLLGLATQVKADTTYEVKGFSGTIGKCSADFAVSISGKPSVTKTTVTGEGKKPSSVNLKIGSTSSGDRTPSGTDGAWSVTTNALNGSAFKNGTYTMTITTPLGRPTPLPPSPFSKAPLGVPVTSCKSYDATKVTFQH